MHNLHRTATHSWSSRSCHCFGQSKLEAASKHWPWQFSWHVHITRKTERAAGAAKHLSGLTWKAILCKPTTWCLLVESKNATRSCKSKHKLIQNIHVRHSVFPSKMPCPANVPILRYWPISVAMVSLGLDPSRPSEKAPWSQKLNSVRHLELTTKLAQISLLFLSCLKRFRNHTMLKTYALTICVVVIHNREFYANIVYSIPCSLIYD